MPRGIRKEIDYCELIDRIDSQLSLLKEKEKTLINERNELLKQQRQHELESLSEIVSLSGMTVEQVINLIKSSAKESA